MDARRRKDSTARASYQSSLDDAPTTLGEVAPPTATTDADPLVGKVVCERYRVEKLLGTGGMGAVYRAMHVHMRRPVALKVLHRQMTFLPEAVARFEREAVAAGRITHPNVAAATDFGRLDDDSFYLALEFVEGTSLRQMLHDTGPLPSKRAVNIARQIAEALAAAHAQGIVHRDLKPENIMLQARGPHEDFIKVLDFGLAKVSTEDAPAADGAELTKMGAVFGTPTYMSPEQAGGGAVDYRTDLYSLGVVLYEMLTGEPPFEAAAVVLLLSKHISEPPPPLPDHIDPRLSNLVSRLLEKSPASRPASARDVVTELVAMRLSIIPPSMHFRASGVLDRLPPRVRRVTDTLLGGARTAWSASLRVVGPVLERFWDAAVKRFPKLELLGRGVGFGRFRCRLGALLAGISALCLLAVLLGGSSSGEPTPTLEDDTASVAEEEAPGSEQAAPIVELDPEGQARLAALEALPVYKRTVQDWLDLGALHLAREDHPASTSAYRNAIQLDRGQANNPIVLGHLRKAAEARDSYEAAITVATTLLGERGMDLLYDLWTSTRGDRKKRPIHELAYKKLEISRMRSASNALRVRLDLEFTKPGECEALKKTLERAVRFADGRSLDGLLALRKTDGCGADGRADCHACLRADGALEDAIETAKRHPGPRFESGRYVPGDD